MTYDNKNRGILFTNNRKQKDTQPDFTGKLNVDGIDLEISGWNKQGKNGTFISLSVKPAQQTGVGQRIEGHSEAVGQAHPLDDEIAF